MPDRQPEPWESSASGSFMVMRRARGDVEVWARSSDRFRVTAPGGDEQLLVGHDAAEQAAQALAEQLD